VPCDGDASRQRSKRGHRVGNGEGEVDKGSDTEFARRIRSNGGACACLQRAVKFINSVGKIILDPGSLRVTKDKVEEGVLLRMNRDWIRHMHKHYPECIAEIVQSF
jgi:hypothetical protein